MTLNFVCPSCGCNDLEAVQTGVALSFKVINIDEEGFFELDLSESDGGCTDRYQCHGCGWIMKDEKGESIKTEEEVVEWVKKNCPQPDDRKK